MQLRLVFSVPKFTGSGFNQTTSAILTGVTIAGAFSTVIFNSTRAKDQLGDAFKSFANALANTQLYEGIKQVAGTFKDWGTTIVAKKDEFKEWVHNYLNASGLKSGAVELYNKLYSWAEIVYDWFANKFLKFISNIPEMVKNWKQLRLSLFKWGTFLGGGGGSALWAMFGSGDNWGKLSELMGRPDFEEIMGDFNQLVEDNQKAFEEMGEEGIRDVLEKYLDNPEEAKQAAKELLEEQKKMKEENEKQPEDKKEESEQLSAEAIQEKFSGQKGGNPETPGQVLNNMIQQGLSGLEKLNYSIFGVSTDKVEKRAKEEMQKYYDSIKEYSKKRKNKSAEAQKQFLDIVEAEENRKINFVDAMAKAAAKAYQSITSRPTIEELNKKFVEVLEGSVTEICTDENCQSVNLAETLKNK